ncbi:diguanylate cyclase [Lachnoclostridium phytofermentans]|uniref:Transcriptional regulator, AraC family n=1 Tax=Lachnoclostridium phytofermentans (strain ATCC 700394 / DSM 18823 / ISDg) TaxID=357809 RepID=A9KR90_LACP7|nr:diguanylate cyclase [Lachnoclostridium phytofermentans]ABX40558.1 transcriptional regulator, AraC family [Lachnoclostridium phytofermentans ISDg]
MKRQQLNIHQILDIFYKSTGIEAIFFDTELNLIMHRASEKLTTYYPFLGISEVMAYLADRFSEQPGTNSAFYTYVLPNNFLCNIAFLTQENSYIGAFLTEPVLLKKLNKSDLDKVLNRSELSNQDKKTFENILFKVPVIPYINILPIGTVLYQLSKTYSENMPQQIIIEHKARTSALNHNSNKKQNIVITSSVKYTPFSTYLQIIEIIKSGDVVRLRSAMNEISVGEILMNQSNDSDIMRSIKNSFIKTCSMGCYAAIDANASYEKVMDISDDYISKIETNDNINDIIALLKEVMISYTKAVAMNRNTIYSKPIRQVMEYIQCHYDEKITLEKLSEYTELSTFYLSNLIKKETDLSLPDIVNKVRIEKSKPLLLNMNISILDVAQRVGFNYQNHFASIFKKYTDLTPTEYRKTMSYKQNTNSSEFENSLINVVEQINNKISMFSHLFDAARIVDPIRHKSMFIKTSDTVFPEETCYHFWYRSESCQNCISMKSYLHNDTFFKIEHRDNDTFLMIATPKTVGKDTYIVEIMKDVTKQLSINIKAESPENPTLVIDKKFREEKDELTGLYNRRYISDQLPVSMRHSILERKSLFIVLFVIDELQSIDNYSDYESYDSILKEFTRLITSSLVNKKDWAGRYAGSLFLLVLYDTDYESACNTADNIKNNFNQTSFQINGTAVKLTANYGVKLLNEDISDVETLILHAFMNLITNKLRVQNIID